MAFKRLSENLVGYGKYIWQRAKTRKQRECSISHNKIKKGDLAWRPLTNTRDRTMRISDEKMKELEGILS